MKKHLLFAALAMASLALTACSASPAKPDSGTDAGGPNDGSCVEDTDCPDPTFFWCHNFKCEPACRNKDDCSDARRGEFALPFCSTADGKLGCQCDEGSCVGSLCSSDADCGSQVCRNGACVAPPAASTVASCQITPDLVVMKSGASTIFHVSAWDASKNPVVVKEGATWTAVGSTLTVTGATTGNKATFTAAQATTGTDAVDGVQAAFGSTTCKAKVVVVPSTVTAGQVGVVVTDELTGRPIENAKVVVSSVNDGAAVDQSGNTFLPTDKRGYATLSTGGAPSFTVSAFHADYGYQTFANYKPSSATAAVLAMSLRRNQTDKYGGYKGTFTGVPANSNVHAALAGMSLPGSVTDLSISQLLGPSTPTDVKIGSSIDQKGVKIPAGVYLEFGGSAIKPQVSGQGLAGTCTTSAGAADESKITTGTCGTRAAWGLAGDIPLSDLPIDAIASGTSNLDIGALLARITPIFKKFNSSIVRDVSFELRAPTTPGDFKDVSFFTPQDHVFTQMPLAFNFVLKLGELPKYAGNYADGAILIGGANAPGRGIIPLGVGVAVNTSPADGLIDAVKDAAGNVVVPAGQVQVRMAPTHHGAEGSNYGILVAAVSAKAITDVSAGLALSALFPRLPNNALKFDPNGASPIDLTAKKFPAFIEGVKYNFTDTAQPGLAGRTFKLGSGTAPTGIDVIRVMWSDGSEHHWDAYVDPATAAVGFIMPKPPPGLADRTYETGLSSGARSDMVVQGLRLAADDGNGAAISYTQEVEFDDHNLDTVTDQLTAFSVVYYAKPKVSFKTPASGTTSIAKSSKITVAVSSFKIGTTPSDDGVVHLSFNNAGAPITGCDATNLSTETTAGKGELDYTLPALCAGAAVTMKAELYRIDGTTPVAPAVSTSMTLAIQ